MRHGLIPIENSLSGTLHSVLELFAQQEPRLWVVGEYQCSESHYIMAKPGTKLEGNFYSFMIEKDGKLNCVCHIITWYGEGEK